MLLDNILSIAKTHELIEGGLDTYTDTVGQRRAKKGYV